MTNAYAPHMQRLYTDRQVYNGGVIGETSAQIKSRFLGDAGRRNQVTIIWAGHNDWLKQGTVQNVADMVAALNAAGNTRYLVMGNLPWANSQYIGGPERAVFEQANAQLAAAHGARFVDLAAYVATLGNGSAGDNADVWAGLIPRSLRWTNDDIHLNDAGSAAVAALLRDGIRSRGW